MRGKREEFGEFFADYIQRKRNVSDFGNLIEMMYDAGHGFIYQEAMDNFNARVDPPSQHIWRAAFDVLNFSLREKGVVLNALIFGPPRPVSLTCSEERSVSY